VGDLSFPDFQAIDFEKKSERFAIADKNGEIFLVNAENLEKGIKLAQSSKNDYTKLIFSENGAFLAGITVNSVINVWNLETNSIIFSTKSGYHVPPQVTFSNDSKHLVYFLSDIKIAGFNLIEKTEIFSHKPLGDITALTISHNNQNLIAAYFDRSIRKFALLSTDPIMEVKAVQEKISGIHFSEDNSVLCMTSNENSIHIFSNSESNPYKFLQLWDGGFLGMDISPSGKLFAFESFDENIRIFSAEDAIEVGVINDQTGTFVNTIRFLKDENYFAAKSENHDLKVWEISSGKAVKTLSGATVPMSEISQSSDGKRLAAAGADGNIYLWDMSSNSLISKLKVFDEAVKKIRFAPGNNEIIVVSVSGLTRIFDLTSYKQLKEFKGKEGSASITALSPSGKFLAAAGSDNYILLTELSSPVNSMTANIGFSPVDVISFSGDSRLLLASSNDRSLYFIDVESGNNLGILYFFGGGEWAFITPDDEFECSNGAFDYLRFVDDNKAVRMGGTTLFNFKEGLLRLVLF
jgi:WD40 repeat protein